VYKVCILAGSWILHTLSRGPMAAHDIACMEHGYGLLVLQMAGQIVRLHPVNTRSFTGSRTSMAAIPASRSSTEAHTTSLIDVLTLPTVCQVILSCVPHRSPSRQSCAAICALVQSGLSVGFLPKDGEFDYTKVGETEIASFCLDSCAVAMDRAQHRHPACMRTLSWVYSLKTSADLHLTVGLPQ
jgi:hypothetical protein